MILWKVRKWVRSWVPFNLTCFSLNFFIFLSSSLSLDCSFGPLMIGCCLTLNNFSSSESNYLTIVPIWDNHCPFALMLVMLITFVLWSRGPVIYLQKWNSSRKIRTKNKRDDDDGECLIYGLFLPFHSHVHVQNCFRCYSVEFLNVFDTRTEFQRSNFIALNKSVDCLQWQTKDKQEKKKWKIIVMLNVHWNLITRIKIAYGHLTDTECVQILCVAIHRVDIWAFSEVIRRRRSAVNIHSK